MCLFSSLLEKWEAIWTHQHWVLSQDLPLPAYWEVNSHLLSKTQLMPGNTDLALPLLRVAVYFVFRWQQSPVIIIYSWRVNVNFLLPREIRKTTLDEVCLAKLPLSTLCLYRTSKDLMSFLVNGSAQRGVYVYFHSEIYILYYFLFLYKLYLRPDLDF